MDEILNTGVANTLAGNDTITSTGTKFNLLRYLETSGTGFYNIGTLNTADDNDIITGIHSPNESDPYPDNPIGLGNIRSYGIFNDRGTIDTGDDNDIIIGISQANRGIGDSSTFYARGITSQEGSINTGNGNDTIMGTGTDTGIDISLYSTLDTGKGDDIITGTSTGPYGTGFYNFYSTIDTGDGSDTITGTGSGYGNGILNFGVIINTGGGNDIITGTTTTGTGIANYSNSTIDTGNGNDIITGIGTDYGIYNQGTINTGNGNDFIIADGGFARYGIYNLGGTIDTGNGNDSIIANGGFSSGGGSRRGIVFLGNGEDYIKGFGSCDFYGGNGNDTRELTPGRYTIERSETGVIFTQPSSRNWENETTIMKTSEFEKLIAGSTIYDFSRLTNGQTIVVA